MADRAADGLERTAMQLADVERRLRKIESGTRLQSASIGAGGITVKDGGAITVETSNGEYELTPFDIRTLRDEFNGNVSAGSQETLSAVYTVPDWAERVEVVVIAHGYTSGSGAPSFWCTIGGDDGLVSFTEVGTDAWAISHSREITSPGATVTAEARVAETVGSASFALRIQMHALFIATVN